LPLFDAIERGTESFVKQTAASAAASPYATSTAAQEENDECYQPQEEQYIQDAHI
jgi:hypothetical protein